MNPEKHRSKPPELYMDLVPLNFKKVDRAATEDQSDDPVRILHRQLR
jgi:hypothetical protein